MAWSVETRGTKVAVLFGTVVTIVFLYVPLAVVVIYAFNDNVGAGMAAAGVHDEVVELALGDEAMRWALWISLQCRLGRDRDRAGARQRGVVRETEATFSGVPRRRAHRLVAEGQLEPLRREPLRRPCLRQRAHLNA